MDTSYIGYTENKTKERQKTKKDQPHRNTHRKLKIGAKWTPSKNLSLKVLYKL